MANPQYQNGFTKIANELYDAIIKWHFSSYEYRVLIFIIRKTYGFNKKYDWISLSQFSEGTHIAETHICRTLSLLVKQNIITKGGKKNSPLYGIQKDYELWKPLPKGVRSHHLPKGGVAKGVIEGVAKGVDTKETIQKKEDIVAKATELPTKEEKTDFKKYESLYLSLLAEYKLPPAMISYGKFRKNLPKVLLYLEEQKETIENYWRWYLDEFHFKENGSNVFATDKYGTEPSTTLSSYFVSKFIKEK